MISLVYKEFNAFFNHLTGYLIISVFLVALGLLVWVFPETSVLAYGFADLEALFVYTPYVFVFMVPAITMRMIAEEKKSGSWELLMTAPLKPHQIVLSKYMAAVMVVLLAVLPTWLYYFSIYHLGAPMGNIDTAGFLGSFLGMLLIGGVFAAIGLFSSALTDNQITAFVIGAFLSFVLYFGFTALADILSTSRWVLMVEELSLGYHYESLSRGVIASGDVYYFLGWIVSLMILTTLMIRKR
ncbi:gliding motility-associated ABC transporter permease subunit GldF [Echinicola vietnamensis]|uniref:Gliding motility-associated ABC transporter permease protein GldF n=1 Tax=Echinicola vietnamensis (strain DSM 17526 / LMG 23754 / KMM 6221) TaxID=926556 RepID=L0FVB1_ECHVK|nr:gliding motility-associated ABC transporter permease subunit GldF [Echinicola vietnamensis]AGA76590.1 gliding motility-associated ABC transporter permease protein GldF [Echinicola vietnamensis DSM 17526]